MPPKRPTTASYSRYLVNAPPSSHSETIYFDDDSHTREIHGNVAPPVISSAPSTLLPTSTSIATLPSTSFNHRDLPPETDQNVIEHLDEPTPADDSEPELIDNVRVIPDCFPGFTG